jgi:hypothetical protein
MWPKPVDAFDMGFRRPDSLGPSVALLVTTCMTLDQFCNTVFLHVLVENNSSNNNNSHVTMILKDYHDKSMN